MDGLPAEHYDRFCRTPVGDFYKKPVRCAAHVVGIADPVRMRERHVSDSEDEEDDIEDVARQYFIYSISPCRTTSLILYVIYRAVDFCTRDLDRLKAEAIADVDAEGCTAPENMYKKSVLCPSHVVSIGDPVYRKRLQSVQAMHRKLED